MIDEQPLLIDPTPEQLGEWWDETPAIEADEDGPSYFHMGMICPDRLPMLSPEQLDEAADSLGFYRSDSCSTRMDVRRSVDATLSQGGRPTPVFEWRRRLLTVALLVDRSADDLQWNTIPDELAEGLAHRGVAVDVLTFHRVPNSFLSSAGHAVDLDDVEEHRRRLLVLLVTDGHGMVRPVEQRALERMARWPRVGWLNPRPEQHDKWGRALADEHGLSMLPCTGHGLIACVKHLAGESFGVRGLGTAFTLFPAKTKSGTEPADSNKSLDEPFSDSSSGARKQPAHKVKAVSSHRTPKGVTALAQCCSLSYEVISLGLIDRLRQRFFPELDPAVIGQLMTAHKARLMSDGLSFPSSVAEELRCGFQQQPLSFRRDVIHFIAEQFVSRSARQQGVGSLFRRDAQTQPDLLTPKKTPDPLPSRCELQARMQLLMLQSLLDGEFVDEDAFVALWKHEALTTAFDHQLETLREFIQSKSIRQFVDWRLRAVESETPNNAVNVPDHLACIPPGEFLMGDPSNEGDSDERPQHAVFVSEFFMEKTLVTGRQWQAVREWAVDHGYQFNEGSASGDDHPIVDVSWFDAVKWCNARSEMEGLDPCYFEDESHQQVLRTGGTRLSIRMVDWDASGYRLPTEAEWEKAARGGLEGQHYPWESPASKSYYEAFSKKRASNNGSSTTAVGEFETNAFGLFDMSGNVWEWCWDAWDSGWHKRDLAREPDTRGPGAAQSSRVYRGGGFANVSRVLRCSYRRGDRPGYAYGNQGFRVVRGRIRQGASGESEGPGGSGEGRARLEVLSDRSSRAIFLHAQDAPGQATVGRLSESSSHDSESRPTVGFDSVAELPPGPHQVEFTAPGYEPATATIITRPFRQRTWRVHMEPAVPANLSRIPGGTFHRGDPSDQGYYWEKPRHKVMVSQFFMEKTAVTWGLWQEVHDWAVNHGYQFENEGTGKADDHPVVNVSWYDAAKWCNARSEMEGLEPCYFDEEWRTLPACEPYRCGEQKLVNSHVNWDAMGYRLPTDAEWEKAARGLDGQHFPWESPAEQDYASLINHDRANYSGGEWQGTSPVETFPANAYGLFDISGNVWEWCWDWYQRYGKDSGSMPHGPDVAQSRRVVRGGSFASVARDLRCSYRNGDHPGNANGYRGFRVVRGRIRPGGERSAGSDEGSGKGRARPEAPSERSGNRRVNFFGRIIRR